MDWQTLSIEVPRERSDVAENALLECGALSVTLGDAGDDPVLETAPGETPLWPRVRLSGLFPAEADPDRTRIMLAAALDREHIELEHAALPDREWTRAWMDRFGPMRFGDRLWIVPRGHECPDRDAVAIELDPGLAFGTGTHATTALCLEWIDAQSWQGRSVVDYGCGSGVLGIAAARLGAARVTCVDHDPQALVATRDNARANAVSDRIETRAPGEPYDEPVDVVLANILFQPLTGLVSRFAALLAPGGTLVMSGVLDDQVAALQDRYRSRFGGFEKGTRDGWARVRANRLD